MEKIAVAKLPQEVEDKLIKETKKLAKTPYNSAEAGVLRNYLDICLEIPWNKKTKDRIDIESARKILDRDHDYLSCRTSRYRKNIGCKINCRFYEEKICTCFAGRNTR